MKKNSLCIVFSLIALFISNACLANTNLTENCDLDKKVDSTQISEKTPTTSLEEKSHDNIPQKKKLLPLGDIVSSILKVPGGIVKGIANIPLDNIISSTLKVPGGAVKFVADIPYDDIIWSTLEISAGAVELLADDAFFIGFFTAYFFYN